MMDRLKEIREAAKATQGVSREQTDWLIGEIDRARKIEDAAFVWRQSWTGRADRLNDENERGIAEALSKYPRPKAS
jgi:hypothetical protein